MNMSHEWEGKKSRVFAVTFIKTFLQKQVVKNVNPEENVDVG